MSSLLRYALLLAGLGLASRSAFGVEIYSLYGEGCRVTTGALVHVGEDTASILTFAGETREVPVRSVQLIARYDVLENPFPRIAPSAGGPKLLQVTSESSEGTFRAFATDFFEDLVLFLDDAGKIRVVQMDEIVSIVRDEKARRIDAPPLLHSPVRLVSPPGRSSCPGPAVGEAKGDGGEGRVATQIMADKLRIDSFWSRMRAGYRDLESLRERTLFYARPLLFDEKTRLGLTAVRTNRNDVYKLAATGWDNVPLYLSFGSGAAYRFQSSTTLGNKSWRMLPQVRPIAALRSEFKSHLLHGMFLANFSGFTAGKQVFASSWSNDPDQHRHAIWLDSSFNHLTLLGADYGAWSVSYGYYYPSFAIGEKNEFREVTSNKTSPVFHVGYTKTAWRAEVFAFYTQMEGDGLKAAELKPGDMESQSSLPGKSVHFYTLQNVPETARINSTSVRLDLSLALPHDLEALTDLVYTQTQYKEHAFRLDQPLATDSTTTTATPAAAPAGAYADNAVKQTLWATRLGLHMDLGKWVALGAEADLEHAETNGSLSGSGGSSKTDQIQTYVATMELLL